MPLTAKDTLNPARCAPTSGIKAKLRITVGHRGEVQNVTGILQANGTPRIYNANFPGVQHLMHDAAPQGFAHSYACS